MISSEISNNPGFAASGSAIQGFHFPFTVQRTFAGCYCHVPVFAALYDHRQCRQFITSPYAIGYSRVQSPEGSVLVSNI